MLQHMNAAVTAPERTVLMGASGFVGGAILSRLKARGFPCLALTRREVDLLKPGAATALASLLRPGDAFVAVSALAPVKTPAMLRDNITMIEAMAEALRARPVSYVLNIGSDAVFADSALALTEESCREPGSLHGIMHLAREVMLGEAARATPYATLRPTLIYGADDPHNGYGPNRFRRLAAAGETIKLFGQGEERRDHVWVEDVADLAARMVARCSCGSLNAATGTVISFREAAEAIASQFVNPPTITFVPRQGAMPHNGYRPFDPAATRAAFPDFSYTLPREGFAKVHAATTRAA
jgi:nucleoside-diphosphate-sugar epimerase